MTTASKYADSCEVEFSDGWIEAQLKERRKNPQGIYRREYTDKKVMGLMTWFAKNNRDVTFALRMRVKVPGTNKGKREYDRIGQWVKDPAALNVANARKEANRRRSRYELEGFTEVRECPTLRLAISCDDPEQLGYEQLRKKRDGRTSKKRKGLPKSWGGHIARFKEIYADFLDQPVAALNMDNLTKSRDRYVKSRMEDPSDEDEFVEGLKRIHSMFKTTMPMLARYFRDSMGWIARDQQVELLTPKGYPKATRYLYPGEWQAAIPAFEQLEAECPGAGWFSRFVFATAARPESALLMKWDDTNWGKWKYLRDEEGREHEALIWLPPPETMKGRSDEEEDAEKPCKLILTGMALEILKRLRVIWENHRKANPESSYDGVFPYEAVQLWRNNRSDTQREIETRSGTGGGKAKWHRKVLRHTHSVYLEFLGCPQRLISQSLTHVPSQAGAAAVTAVYTGADPVDRFMKNEPLAELGLWHLRLHQLIRDMEEGTKSPELVAICESLQDGQLSRNMRKRYDVDRKFIEVQEKAKAPKLRIVG